MTKPFRKNRPPQKQKIPALDKQKNMKKIVALAAILILAAIPFGLGKYFELNRQDPFDSGANVYSAKHVLEGARIGIDEKPSAALGTLLVNMLGVWMFGFNETGPKIIQGLFQLGALVLMFLAMRKLFGTLGAAVGVIITSLYLSAPVIAKFGNVKEQYMIACMVIGISCFVLYQLSGKWWYAILAGAFVIWAPLFKETGTSAIGALTLFIIAQPFLKNRTIKQTGIDIMLLLAGAAVALAPLYIWMIACDVQMRLPYSFVWKTLVSLLPATDAQKTKAITAYVSSGRRLVPFSQQWPKVLLYYKALITPIALAITSIVAAIGKLIFRGKNKTQGDTKLNYDRFVLLFAVWWILDMAFVWISPRSYQQYYLPLNASAAMLAGYIITLYHDKLEHSVYNKGKWIIVGLLGLLVMIITSWSIIFGFEKSPDTNMEYGERRRGYAQSLRETSKRREQDLTYTWERLADYIGAHSKPTDKIYVWGWYPGIYVRAQRFSPTPKAFLMPRPAPAVLTEQIEELLADFEKEKPKFIVDSRKRNIPMERPPYEIWPIAPKGFFGIKKPDFIPLNEKIIAVYDKQWSDMLRKRFDEDEALRYNILKPLRQFVMQNYEIVEPSRIFWPHVLFRLKNTATD